MAYKSITLLPIIKDIHISLHLFLTSIYILYYILVHSKLHNVHLKVLPRGRQDISKDENEESHQRYSSINDEKKALQAPSNSLTSFLVPRQSPVAAERLW